MQSRRPRRTQSRRMTRLQRGMRRERRERGRSPSLYPIPRNRAKRPNRDAGAVSGRTAWVCRSEALWRCNNCLLAWRFRVVCECAALGRTRGAQGNAELGECAPESFVNARRWGALAELGIALCTAHHLVIAARDQADAAKSGASGQLKGPMAAFSVDKVSTGYDTGAVTLPDAGFWNLTSYGVRYLTLARSMGAGGVQV